LGIANADAPDLPQVHYSLGVIVVDSEYPVRPAFSLLAKVLDEFSTSIPASSYGSPSAISFPQLQTYLEKFRDPRQADAIMKVQAELDETKIILVGIHIII
jgi:synaptobrevin homolog YKT6